MVRKRGYAGQAAVTTIVRSGPYEGVCDECGQKRIVIDCMIDWVSQTVCEECAIRIESEYVAD